jgi:hypothetical protein
MVSGRPISVNDSISAPAGELGLFVQPAHACPRRQDAAGVPPNWLCLYETLDTVPQTPQFAQVWLCLFTATPLLADGHARLGLFVQLSPIPPGELALFGTVRIALEWWNDGILE